MPRLKKYYFRIEDLEYGYPNAMVADYGLAGDEIMVEAETNFAAETIAWERFKEGRYDNRKTKK